MNYRDDYPTCDETFVTLIIASRNLDWDAISKQLGLKPTRTNEARKCLSEQAPYVWMLSTRGKTESKDTRRHLHDLLAHLEGKSVQLEKLRNKDCLTEVSCFWSSALGHGGPSIDPISAAKLAELNLTLSFDFYDASSETTVESDEDCT